MEAAAHGRSTLGIPQSVGKEFVAASPKGTAHRAKHRTLGEQIKSHLTPSGRLKTGF